jgi:hypothetical protein
MAIGLRMGYRAPYLDAAAGDEVTEPLSLANFFCSRHALLSDVVMIL